MTGISLTCTNVLISQMILTMLNAFTLLPPVINESIKSTHIV